MTRGERREALENDVEKIMRCYAFDDGDKKHLTVFSPDSVKREIVALFMDRAAQGWFKEETECSP